eukprot:TRINITY_DN3025_c0_g1_i1.p1 TRINITY_DN3025_c0_g1~~TRINITY_DN3025_c0_g1_i1.p1  ORF type:complete len:291 (+),score=57.32 TRINITY_DN3025_c0_g1_i1:71-943(+)
MFKRAVLLCAFAAAVESCNTNFADTCLLPYSPPTNLNNCSSHSWSTEAACMCNAHFLTCYMENGCATKCASALGSVCGCEAEKVEYEKVFDVDYIVGDSSLFTASAFKAFFNQRIAVWVLPSWTTVTVTPDLVTTRRVSVKITIPHDTTLPKNVDTQLREMLLRFPALRQLTTYKLTLKSSPSVSKGKDYSSSSGWPIGGIVALAVGCGVVVLVIILIIFCKYCTKEQEKELKQQRSMRAIHSFSGGRSMNSIKTPGSAKSSSFMESKSPKETNPPDAAPAADANAPDMV